MQQDRSFHIARLALAFAILLTLAHLLYRVIRYSKLYLIITITGVLVASQVFQLAAVFEPLSEAYYDLKMASYALIYVSFWVFSCRFFRLGVTLKLITVEKDPDQYNWHFLAAEAIGTVAAIGLTVWFTTQIEITSDTMEPYGLIWSSSLGVVSVLMAMQLATAVFLVYTVCYLY